MTLVEAKQIARSPLPVLAACSDNAFDEQFRVVLASLPKRNSDEVSGELMTRAYRGKLGAFSAAQIAFLWDAVLERCQWFPSIAECLTILAEWERDDDAVKLQERAKTMVFWERQNRFDATMAALAAGDCDQAEIDAMPDRWKEMAVTYGHLQRDDDGRFVPRSTAPAPEPEKSARPSPSCARCQDIGRILTLEGEEADCPACAMVPA